MLDLQRAHQAVGGELVSAGGTGTYDLNSWATEIQAGSYALMDTEYAKTGVPFRQALSVLATVISVAARWAVADCGLKALGMDHGNPSIDGATVLYCSDEHVTFVPDEGRPVRVGDRIHVIPAHVDPTVAYHAHFSLVDGDDVSSTPGPSTSAAGSRPRPLPPRHAFLVVLNRAHDGSLRQEVAGAAVGRGGPPPRRRIVGG